MLAPGQERECISLSATRTDRFAAIDWSATADGAVFVHGAAAWLDYTQYREVLAGDHLIVLLRIHLAGNDSSVAPLVFHASRFAGSRLDDLAAHRGIVGRLSGGKAPWNRC